MKVLKLDMKLVRENLQYRHEQGKLKDELPYLAVAAECVTGRANAQIETVLLAALDITGLPRPIPDPNNLEQQQVRCYVLCEGGFLGAFAARQPADFYIDDRTGFKRKEKTAIYQAVQRLVALAEKKGLNPKMLPDAPSWHNCGIF